MKKKECIVHIGMYKTGSSSIQGSLHKYLESETHHYFDLNEPNHSRRILSLFSKEKTHHTHKRRGFSKSDIETFNRDTREMLSKSIDTNAHPIMILSAEGTSSILLKRELEVFRNLMLSLENVSEEEYYNKNILEKYKKI